MTKETTKLDFDTRDGHDGSLERLVVDDERQAIFLAGGDANLRSRTRRTIAVAILFALPIDEPLRKEYLLRLWRGNHS